MITQWFQPEPVFAGLPLAKALEGLGHEVQVLTGFPNYPGGRLYAGYKLKPWQRETMDGVDIVRVPLYPSHDRNGLRRIANYLSFAISATVLGPALVRRPDVIYVYNLVTLGWAARLLRRINGSPIVFHVQDLWPESVSGSGMLGGGLLLRVLSRWCQAEYRAADRIVVLSPGFKRNLVERGVGEEVVDVIYNWSDEGSLGTSVKDSRLADVLGFSGRFNVVFAGTMGVMQDLKPVIDAAREMDALAPDVLFTFVGAGVEVENLKRAATGLTNVQFLARRPTKEIGAILALADALLVHLKADPLFEITIPSKIQAYLHAGRPILCGVKGDAADLIQAARAGVPFLPGDSQSLVSAVMELRTLSQAEREAMGERGRRFYSEHTSLAVAVRKLDSIFSEARLRGTSGS